jgi:hypothetical protein
MFQPMKAIIAQDTTKLHPHTQKHTQHRRPTVKEHDHHWDSQQDFSEFNFFINFNKSILIKLRHSRSQARLRKEEGGSNNLGKKNRVRLALADSTV